MFAQSLTRMITMIRKDALTGSRDQITLYMLISPVLLGLMLALLMPILEDAGPSFVIAEGLGEADRVALERHGEVEIVGDRNAVIERVGARDDVTGIVPTGDGNFEVIVEGDEPEALQALPRAIIEGGHEPAPTDAEATAPLRLIATSLLAYCVTVIVGLMLGFAILEEKATNIYVAFDISPLRFAEYLGAKLLLGTALALAMTVLAIALALGLDVDWLGVLVTTLASVPFAISLGLIVGVVAKDQLGAVAIMKGLLPVWCSLPVLGFVLPEAWLWTQFPFANHWGVQGLFHALGDGDGVGVWACAALNLATGLPVLLATAWMLRRKLGFA